MEDAAFVIGVVKFNAVRSDAPTDSKKCLSGGQHAYRRCDEIDPEGVPITFAGLRIVNVTRPWSYFVATVFTASDCGIALMLKSAGGSTTSASGL